MIRLGWLRKIISSKKIIIFLLVLFALLLFGGRSQASWISYGVVGYEFTNTAFQNYDLAITNNVNFMTNQNVGLLTLMPNVFYYWSGDNINFYARWISMGVPHSYVGDFKYYFVCDLEDTTQNFSTFHNCQTLTYDSYAVNNILSQVRLGDSIYYGNPAPFHEFSDGAGAYFFAINVNLANKLILFYQSTTDLVGWSDFCQLDSFQYGIPCVIGNYNNIYSVDNYDYNNFPNSFYSPSPIQSTIPTPDVPNVYEPTSQVNSGDIINYYENTSVYDFNEGDCFVGTWDLDSNNDEDFRYNNGYHIFYFFKNHYNITDEYYSLSDVGGFINALMYNYDTYFNYGNRYTNGDIVSVKDYDFDSHRTVETFSGFTNPFTNKPLVYETYPYFLNYYHRNFSRAYDGKDLASYCYYKLGFSSHSTGYNGNDFSGSYICGNGETCFVNTDDYGEAGNLVGNITSAQQYNWGVYTINSKNYQNSYSYLSGDTVINSESWDGTPLDYFNDDIPSNFDEKDFISSSFTRFRSVFEDIDLSDLGDELLGFLPTYIITFMLALIFFRFLQH